MWHCCEGIFSVKKEILERRDQIDELVQICICNHCFAKSCVSSSDRTNELFRLSNHPQPKFSIDVFNCIFSTFSELVLLQRNLSCWWFEVFFCEITVVFHKFSKSRVRCRQLEDFIFWTSQISWHTTSPDLRCCCLGRVSCTYPANIHTNTFSRSKCARVSFFG